MIRLDRMTAEEFAPFIARLDEGYAENHVRAGTWDRASALEHARNETRQLLPQGVDSADQFLNVIRDSTTGNRVGDVWYAVRREGSQPQLFVYWLGIDAAHRRRGYAGEALKRVEEEAHRLGCRRVALHVFADNAGARALYSKMGYLETNVMMAKSVPS